MNVARQGLDVEASELFGGGDGKPRVKLHVGRVEEEQRRHVHLL